MTTSKSSTNPYLAAVRWTARISSILFIGIFLLMFLGEGFEPAKVTPIEWVMLLFGPFGLVLGMLLGWWKEGLGGAIVILSLFASLIVGDYSGAGGGYMFICASPGFLFLKRPKPHFSMWRNQNGLTRTSLLAHKTKC